MAGVLLAKAVRCSDRQVALACPSAACESENVPNFSFLQWAALVPPAGITNNITSAPAPFSERNGHLAAEKICGAVPDRRGDHASKHRLGGHRRKRLHRARQRSTAGFSPTHRTHRRLHGQQERGYVSVRPLRASRPSRHVGAGPARFRSSSRHSFPCGTMPDAWLETCPATLTATKVRGLQPS